MAKFEFMKEILNLVAPGTNLRAGLENILEAECGALIMLMNEEDISRCKDLIQPGFFVNSEYTPQKVYELSKMDGAVIINENATKILYANVQFTPDPTIPTNETGMRHRNAERMAKQTGKPTIAISRRRAIVSIYWGAYSYVLKDINFLTTRVDQGLKAIEKYKDSYNKSIDHLEVLEMENRVTLFEVCKVLEKAVKAQTIGNEIEPYLWEMGSDGRLARIQMDEMLSGIKENIELLILDYYNTDISLDEDKVAEIYKRLFLLSDKELLDYIKILHCMNFKLEIPITEYHIIPKGFRMMNNIPKIPMSVIYNLVRTFGNLNGIDSADPAQLKEVEGIGDKRTKAIIEGLESQKHKANIYARIKTV